MTALPCRLVQWAADSIGGLLDALIPADEHTLRAAALAELYCPKGCDCSCCYGYTDKSCHCFTYPCNCGGGPAEHGVPACKECWCSGVRLTRGLCDGCAQAAADALADANGVRPDVSPDFPAGEPSDPAGSAEPAGSLPDMTQAAWITPAVTDVLADHHPHHPFDGHRAFDGLILCYSASLGRIHADFPDRQAWRDHVGPLIAQRVVESLEALIT